VRDYDNQNRTDKQLKGSRTFHQTSGVHDREIIIRARQNKGKVEPFDPVARKQDRSKQLRQELKDEQKTTDAKTERSHRMGIAVAVEKFLRLKTEHLEQRAIATGSRSTRHRTN
jgi:hypothetical protein